MKSHSRRLAPLVLLLPLCSTLPVAAEPARPTMTMPVTGSFHGNGTFQGTAAINRFEQRGNQVVAIGFISGVLTRANHTVGTVVAGEVVWPVATRSGGVLMASRRVLRQTKPSLISFESDGR